MKDYHDYTKEMAEVLKNVNMSCGVNGKSTIDDDGMRVRQATDILKYFLKLSDIDMEGSWETGLNKLIGRKIIHNCELTEICKFVKTTKEELR